MGCYYELLGLSVDATEEEIRRSFRRMALRWHPDHCKDPEATERFKELVKAYETLINPVTREHYNRSLGYRSNVRGDGQGGKKRTIKGSSFPMETHLEETIRERLKEYFGISWGRGSNRHWWSNLRFDIYLTPEQIREDRTEVISYTRLVYCKICMAKPGKFRDCNACTGRGFVEETYTMEVRIPAGCPDRYSIYYPGVGDFPSPDMPPGGLIVRIYVL
ncbi:MAG: DnaJ domain-containing protein [Syntrophobacterales bacterium]|nr:DnaJ domain-containing protein [Syntrophobacterales bacterium]